MVNSSSNNIDYSVKHFDRSFPIAIIKDSDLQLSLLPPSSSQHQLSSAINIATWKDQRLGHLDIPKDLIEILEINGFTIETILEYGPAQIAKIIRINDFFAEMIFNETMKMIN